MQEPETIILGVKRKCMGVGSKRKLVETKDTFQYVPLLPGLQSLLKNDDVRHEVSLEDLQVNSSTFTLS